MTYEEAIDELKSCLNGAIYVDTDYVDGITLEATRLAIEALKKQVPAKPKVIAGKFTWLYRCITCNGWLEKDEKYCECGQRILWE